MKQFFVLVAVVSVATAGAAGAQVATTCNVNGQWVYCNSYGQPVQPVDQTIALQVRTVAQQQQQAAEAQLAQERAEQLRLELQQGRRAAAQGADCQTIYVQDVPHALCQ